MERRDLLKGAAAASVLLGTNARLSGASSDHGVPTKGWGMSPLADADPLEVKIAAFNTVTPNVDASIGFYRDVMGFAILEEGRLASGASTAPGASRLGQRYAILASPGFTRGAQVRLLEAPRGARPNRPRPGSTIIDPGLAVMECQTKDPAESYRILKNAGVPMISPPRYYFFHSTSYGRNLDVMSYSPFGPGGEQLFITANVRSDRPQWPIAGVHGNFTGAAVVSLDQRPVEAFYERALGLKRVNQMESVQRNTNELTGAPADNYFLWGFLGKDVRLEIWEHKQLQGTIYPTTLDRTGLAMLTVAVNDLDRCRAMCRRAGIRPVGEGALPLVGRPRPDGFTLRGAVGELIEVVGKT